MNNTCFLVLSAGEWKDNAVSNMQISAQLSKENSVIYVETPGRRFPKLSEYKRLLHRLKRIFISPQSKLEGLDPINAIIFSPFAIPNHNYWIFRKINSFLLGYQLRKLLKKYDFNNFHVWVFSPYWVDVIQKLTYKKLIFHCVDALHTYDSSASFKKNLQHLTICADVIFTPNQLIYDDLSKDSDRVFKIGHGVSKENLIKDSTLNFRSSFSDEDNFNLNKITYSGTLANWVDYELLIELAQKFSNSQIVLVGYVHALTNNKFINKMKKMDNIIFAGYQNYSDLPRFYQDTDLAIIPYDSNNEHIQYSTPTKFLDYFAYGLPVISTDFPAAWELSNLIEIATSKEDFIEKVIDLPNSDIIRESSRLSRIEYASSHTWENQVKKMVQKLNI